jgi:hypothetical protein
MFRVVLAIAMSLVTSGHLLAQENDFMITVRLLDPRVVANTAQTMSIEWEDVKTDIIATRTLTRSERDTLAKLAEAELTDDDSPFCGHYPAYGILYRRKDGSVAKTQTICGLCMTWASAGELRAIKGKQTLEYLQKLLPLPDYFADPKTAKEVVVNTKNKKVPYFELEKKQ